MLACTATVTHGIRKEVIKSLEMPDCETVTTSPDRLNIYEVHVCTDMETDFMISVRGTDTSCYSLL